MIERVERSLNILMVNSTRGFVGGVEKLMVQMAAAMRKVNYHVYGLFEHTAHEDESFDAVFDDIEVLSSPDLDDLINDYSELGIDVVCIHKTSNYNLVKALQDRFPTVVIVHDHDYYCIRRHKYFPYKRKNCYLPFSAYYCTLCAGLVEKQGSQYKMIDSRSKYLLLKQIRKCDLSFVLSEYMKKNLLMNQWDESRIHKLLPYQPTGNDVGENVNQIPVVLFVGQLIRGKGVDLLLKALALIKIPFKCQILGRGNDDGYLATLVSRLKLADKVEFLGWTQNVSALYSQADLVVVPSRWQEPFGLVGLEAFAHKKPVVAFEIGGIPEWLKHKVNGILVRPEDIRRLALAITSLMKDPVKRNLYGKAGFSLVENSYSSQQFSASLIEPLTKLAMDYEKRN